MWSCAARALVWCLWKERKQPFDIFFVIVFKLLFICGASIVENSFVITISNNYTRLKGYTTLVLLGGGFLIPRLFFLCSYNYFLIKKMEKEMPSA